MEPVYLTGIVNCPCTTERHLRLPNGEGSYSEKCPVLRRTYEVTHICDLDGRTHNIHISVTKEEMFYIIN